MGKGDLVKKIWRRTKLPRAQGHETKPVTSRTQGHETKPVASRTQQNVARGANIG